MLGSCDKLQLRIEMFVCYQTGCPAAAMLAAILPSSQSGSHSTVRSRPEIVSFSLVQQESQYVYIFFKEVMMHGDMI